MHRVEYREGEAEAKHSVQCSASTDTEHVERIEPEGADREEEGSGKP